MWRSGVTSGSMIFPGLALKDISCGLLSAGGYRFDTDVDLYTLHATLVKWELEIPRNGNIIAVSFMHIMHHVRFLCQHSALWQ